MMSSLGRAISARAMATICCSPPLKVEASPPEVKQPLEEGTLTFIDNQVNRQTGTILLKGTFANKEKRLWPGQFVQVSVRLYEQADAIVIPSRALQTGPEGPYVYVIKPDLTAEIRKVTVERTQSEQAVVKGLAKEEQVVTRGSLRLTPGAKVQIRAATDGES